MNPEPKERFIRVQSQRESNVLRVIVSEAQGSASAEFVNWLRERPFSDSVLPDAGMAVRIELIESYDPKEVKLYLESMTAEDWSDINHE